MKGHRFSAEQCEECTLTFTLSAMPSCKFWILTLSIAVVLFSSLMIMCPFQELLDRHFPKTNTELFDKDIVSTFKQMLIITHVHDMFRLPLKKKSGRYSFQALVHKDNVISNIFFIML